MGFLFDAFGSGTPQIPSAAGVQNFTRSGTRSMLQGPIGTGLMPPLSAQRGVMGGSGMTDLLAFTQDEVMGQARKDATGNKGGTSAQLYGAPGKTLFGGSKF
jgi:hypothetical protein